MMFPFVNWFWKRDKTPKFYWNWSASQRSAIREFDAKNREYQDRLAHFESHLDESLYREYMELRKAAQETNFAWNRVETLSDLLAQKLD